MEINKRDVPYLSNRARHIASVRVAGKDYHHHAFYLTQGRIIAKPMFSALISLRGSQLHQTTVVLKLKIFSFVKHNRINNYTQYYTPILSLYK